MWDNLINMKDKSIKEIIAEYKITSVDILGGEILHERHNNSKHRVIVTDAVMGAGKTQKAIMKMKAMVEANQKFLYVTPFLGEIARVRKKIAEVKEPYFGNDGEYGTLKTKRAKFLEQLEAGEYIATTHSMFSSLMEEDYKKMTEYTLILDEVIQPMELVKVALDDLEMLKRSGLISVDKVTGRILFTNEDYWGVYSALKKKCDSSAVYLFNNTILVWAFPPVIFTTFKRIQVLTYMFGGSLLSAYFELNKISYHIEKHNDAQYREDIKKKLNIYDGVSNKIGGRDNAFSVGWLKNKLPDFFKKTKFSSSHIVSKVFDTNTKETAYTTFKAFQTKLAGAGYTRGFIPITSRSTNEFMHKRTMLYFGNRYLPPPLLNYFLSHDIDVDIDKWALAEMLQWLWRGCIRNGEPMNIFIPSYRMRKLLLDWLDGKY